MLVLCVFDSLLHTSPAYPQRCVSKRFDVGGLPNDGSVTPYRKTESVGNGSPELLKNAVCAISRKSSLYSIWLCCTATFRKVSALKICVHLAWTFSNCARSGARMVLPSPKLPPLLAGPQSQYLNLL